MIPQEFINHALAGVPYNVGMYEVIHPRHDRDAITLVKRVIADNDVGFARYYASFINADSGDVSSWVFNNTNCFDWLNDFLQRAKIPLEIYSYSTFKNPWDQHRRTNLVDRCTIAELVAYTGAE